MTFPKPEPRGPKPRRPIARSTQRIRVRRPAGTVRRLAKAAGEIDPCTWDAVLDFYRDPHGVIRCAYCLTNAATQQEHVVPLSKGGAHHVGNLVVACEPCNRRKGTQTWEPKLRHPWMTA